MIERVVEDWLTNVNELGYEDAFMHALLAQGHTIVHKQKHGLLELGKDLITKERGGTFCCYQLKGGDIDFDEWNKISGEIQSLVSSPILHPNVLPNAQFSPFLVTNGNITDTVRADIQNRNNVWQQQYKRKLRLVLYGDLLKMFRDLQNAFLPTKPRDFELFLNLYLANKKEPLDTQRFSLLIRSILPEEKLAKAALRRTLSAATIICNYVISGYEAAGNFYAAAEAWAMLIFHIFRTCELLPEVSEETSAPIISLAAESLDRCASETIEEARKSTSWMEGDPFVDEQVWPYRQMLLVGIVSAFVISRRIAGQPAKFEYELCSLAFRNVSEVSLVGESVAPAIYLAASCMHLRGLQLAAAELAASTIDTITRRNNVAKEYGTPDPYFSVEDIMKNDLKLDEVFEEDLTFRDRSFCIRQFVEFLVRRNWPQMLRKRWYQISGVDWVVFVPERQIDSYWWHCEKGTTESRRWDHPQRWSSLVDQATTLAPEPLLMVSRYMELLPYFFVFMPHRFTPELAKALDMKILKLSE